MKLRQLMPATVEPTQPDRRFDEFLREHHDPLVSFLRRRTRTQEDARDAAQESFARLIRYLATQPADNWKPLLYRIALNVANDQSRWAQRHRQDGHVPLDAESHALPSEEPSLDHRLILQQELARIGAVIEVLPPRCQEIYLLSRVEGMTNAEIARHCGISLKAVEKQMTKAMAAVRQALGDFSQQAPRES